MKTVTSEMLFKSALFSILLGALSGMLYALIIRISSLFLGVLKRLAHKERKDVQKHVFSKNMLDFIFVILLGTLHLLSDYVLLDGVFASYTAIMLLVAFFASKAFFSKILGISRKR